MKTNKTAVQIISLLGLGATSFVSGLADWHNPLAPAAAVAGAMDPCARCKGRLEDGPDNRCEDSKFGGDFCAGRCDELGLCTCREVGDCDGYAE